MVGRNALRRMGQGFNTVQSIALYKLTYIDLTVLSKLSKHNN